MDTCGPSKTCVSSGLLLQLMDLASLLVKRGIQLTNSLGEGE